MLQVKNIINMDKTIHESISLSKEGLKYNDEGLPEHKILKVLQNKDVQEYSMSDIIKEADIDKKQTNIAIGWLMRKHWTKLNNKKIIITDTGINTSIEDLEESQLLKLLVNNTDSKDIPKEFNKTLNEFRKRKGILNIKTSQSFKISLKKLGEEILKEGFTIQKEATQLTHEQLKSGEWKKLHYRGYDVNAETPINYPGKIHPLAYTIDEIRNIFLDMGFFEDRGNIVESAFWNFDCLFQPQDHAAREMQDTFYVSNPNKAKLPEQKLVNHVKDAHETGANTGSDGWNYDWNMDIARQTVLRTHTTCLSVRHLANNKPPLKMFSVGRVFRRETINYKHLPEFHQVEGIVADEDLSFKNLLGILKEFYKKLGFKVRFRPAYFPYTYLSTECEIYVKEKKSWMELGGSGMFRPEVLEPLNIKTPVAAFGLGIERLAMMRYDINDIRMLYESDIGWLRDLPVTYNLKQ